MVARFRSWRQKTRKPIEVIGFIAVLVVAIALIFVEVRVYGTGFTGKTLWDWVRVLYIHVLLAVEGCWFNQNERKAGESRADNERKAVELRADNERKVAEKRDKTAREIAEDNQREVALQAYLDKISELLLEKHLRDSDEGDEVRKIARVRTLTVFPRLDPHRKRSVLQFLQESGLIDKDKRIVAVNEADLSNADLCAAQLRGADLCDDDLSKAQLRGADLRANLSGTLPFGPTVTTEQLEKAASLKGATMPDGSIHP